MKFEQVDFHVEKNFNTVEEQKALPKVDVHVIYPIARPILVLIAKMPIPKKWKTVINALVAALDVVVTDGPF